MARQKTNIWKMAMPSKWAIDGKSALIIAHMQQGIVGKGTYTPVTHESEIQAIKKYGVIEKQLALIRAFRQKRLPVIFVSVIPNPIGKLPAYGMVYKAIAKSKVIGKLDVELVRKEAEIIPEMGRRSSEPHLYHTGISAFTNSELDTVLKFEGVKTVVLAGWTAHSSVYNCCVAAAERWYSVIIPRDASGSPEHHRKAYEATMDIMAPCWALVTTTDDVIAHL
jgi:nicotinamidase-related amidase